MEFIKDKLKKIVHKNYKYIEILYGTLISDNIFDSNITKEQYEQLLTYFTTKLKNYDCKTIISKNYEILNKRLNINEQFQQRCFEQTLIDNQYYNHKNKDDYMITFGEKKMISIENFDIFQNYYNVLLKKVISFNIKNQFYLNFITNKNENNKINYSISIYITKKNGKYNEIIQSILLYLDTIQQIV